MTTPATPPRPTLRDVAQLAGVSRQTVSNVVRGNLAEMKPETRARVEVAMSELGYHPNASAQGLRSSRTRTLAFLVLDQASSFMADPLTALIFSGVSDVARDSGYELLLRGERPLDEGKALLRPVNDGRVDGAFLLLSGASEIRRRYIAEMTESGVPFVVFDEIVEDSAVMSVRTDERSSARALTAHLLDQGHRRIGFVAAKIPWAVIEQRHLGYIDAMEEAGVLRDASLELFEAAWQAQGGEDMAHKLLTRPDPPDAIMCASDVLAAGVMSAARSLGRRVPDDVAVVGFDDFEFSAHIDPPLTTVRVPAHDMGLAAARLLLQILGGTAPEALQIVLQNEVVIRASG